MKSLESLVLLVGLLSVAAVACGGGDEPASGTTTVEVSDSISATDDTDTNDAVSETSDAAAEVAVAAPSGGTTVVNMEDPGESGSYIFDPAELTFSVGETVTFDLVSENEFHTFTVTDLGINVAVNGGESGTLEFTFDTAGTYNLICIPHQALGMVGTITVQ